MSVLRVELTVNALQRRKEHEKHGRKREIRVGADRLCNIDDLTQCAEESRKVEISILLLHYYYCWITITSGSLLLLHHYYCCITTAEVATNFSSHHSLYFTHDDRKYG